MKTLDKFTREWITVNAIEEIANYELGVLTLRGLHYRLVSRGMTNSLLHYRRVVTAMIKARWAGLVVFETFSDHDREVLGGTNYRETTVESAEIRAKQQVRNWMNSYSKNRWENQDTYLEVWIEKKALVGTFQPICDEWDVALSPCKGYPSLTFLNDAKERFQYAQKTHKTKILYFGDYDPSGENIPVTIQENLLKLGIDVEVDRRLLMEDQVVEMKLPPAPVKQGDPRTVNWDGLGQVELDAIEPSLLKKFVSEAIEESFDEYKYEELLAQETEEEVDFRLRLVDFVKTLG